MNIVTLIALIVWLLCLLVLLGCGVYVLIRKIMLKHKQSKNKKD